MDPTQAVSVVITTYNRSDALLAVLGGLAHQTDSNFDIVVADDGSREEHRLAVSQSAIARSLRVTHVWHPDVGFTASKVRNRGVAACTSAYIIFLDGDCVPEVDFIAQHKLLARPGCFVNGSRVLLSPRLTERVVSASEHVFGRGIWYWLGKRFAGDASKLTHLLRLPGWSFRLRTEFSWKGIRSCNLGVWRSDFEQVDGFDESFIGWGHEDADFVLRLHHAGLVRKNGFCATEVFHLWHKESPRDHESGNAGLVQQRQTKHVVRATSGYMQFRLNDDVEVIRLG
jgi:glycosyltransferase involved in cell wall biosynthesis